MTRTLRPEDRISHYRIVGPLGAGGMGEVYRAQDQSLERDVALKILPPELVQSEERVRRFVLEAKSASSLNHPHIVTIYEIGQDRVRSGDSAPEPDSSPLHFISMELVSGKTLAAKIHQEQTDLKTLLGWLAQAAEGLSKAHAAGIVHRDLKPGNIMVTQDGYAKVLDFGLAKLTERQVAGPDLTSAPTVTDEGTGAGVVLGTVGYMSPEQVQGKPVDHRSDVFSFGAILYEAATRRRPFAAESQVETMHQILHTVPEPIEGLNPEAPAELRRLIRRCLAKDPNQRLDSMKTLALELREIVDEYEALSASGTSGSGLAQDGPVKRRSITMPIVGALAIVIASIFTLVPRGPARLNPDMRTHAVDVPMSGIRYPALSQDGRWIALPARDDQGIWGLYYMNATGGEVRPIAVDTTVSVVYADISPDGGQIAYSVATPGGVELRIVPTLGGLVRTLARAGSTPRWSTDGRRIGYMDASSGTTGRREYWSIRPDGSGRERLCVDSTNTPGGRSCFTWSPDGKRIAWLRNFTASTYNEIIVRDLASGRERQLTHDRKIIDEITWTRQDEVLFSSNRGGATNLWIMRSSGGPTVQVTRGMGPDLGVRVSGDGRTVLYLVQQPLVRVGWWDVVTGQSGRVTRGDERIESVRPSPDGLRVAVGVHESDALSRSQELTVMSRDGGDRRTLVPPEEDPRAWDWSPDGRRIAWASVKRSPRDSIEVRIVDVATGEASPPFDLASTGAPVWLRWAQMDTLRVADDHGTFGYSFATKHSFGRSPDMTFDMPLRTPGWVVTYDDRATSRGIYVRPAEGGTARLVVPLSWFPWAPPTDGKFGYCWPESLGLCRIQLPSGRLEPLAHKFAEGRRNIRLMASRDGRVIYWRQQRESSKLVLIENLH